MILNISSCSIAKNIRVRNFRNHLKYDIIIVFASLVKYLWLVACINLLSHLKINFKMFMSPSLEKENFTIYS